MEGLSQGRLISNPRVECTPREDNAENYWVGWFLVLKIMGNKDINKISFPSSHVLMVTTVPTNVDWPNNWEETITAEDCPPNSNTITIK